MKTMLSCIVCQYFLFLLPKRLTLIRIPRAFNQMYTCFTYYPVVCASRTVCLSNSTVKSLLGTYLDEFTDNDMLLLTSLGRNIY